MGSAVTKYGHVGLRVIAVVAFAGTAALAVTLSRAPARPDHAALSSNLIQSPCTPSGLEAWLGLAQTAGSTSVTGTGDRLEPGGTYYTLEFTNVSARVCSLYGYPVVSAYAGDQVGGTQVGSTAARDTSVRPRPVTLAPGQTAHSVLRVTRSGPRSCLFTCPPAPRRARNSSACRRFSRAPASPGSVRPNQGSRTFLFIAGRGEWVSWA
jgi:hypothetical protein